MGLEIMACCGALTHVYADAGNRTHNPGCAYYEMARFQMENKTKRFTPPAHGDVQVLGLSESGSDMLLWTIFCPPIEYDRADSEALARQLEMAAEMVRRHA